MEKHLNRKGVGSMLRSCKLCKMNRNFAGITSWLFWEPLCYQHLRSNRWITCLLQRMCWSVQWVSAFSNGLSSLPQFPLLFCLYCIQASWRGSPQDSSCQLIPDALLSSMLQCCKNSHGNQLRTLVRAPFAIFKLTGMLSCDRSFLVYKSIRSTRCCQPTP